MLIPHPCSEFLNQYLSARKLNHPTGKPLYTYKTSRAEYEALKELLATAPPANSTSACFVLYAAEWWRQNYAGGHWEWEPIFNEINRPNWNAHTRRDPMMTTGCQFWKRQLFQHDNGSNSLLGTLFFESGIPRRLLTNEGYIKNLIIKSFSFLETYRTRREDTFACIRELAQTHQLPGSLNVDSFFDLIFNVVSKFLIFKTNFYLGSQEQPLAFLNGQMPAWREELPLRIDDDPMASTFLDSLLVDVARMAKQEVSIIGLAYSLVPEQGEWTIKTQLSIPNGFHTAENLLIDPELFSAFTGKVALKIVSGTTERVVGYGFKNGNNQLSISGLSAYPLPTKLYASPWQLVFADSQTDQQASVDLPYSDGLDTRLPWVFTQPDEGHGVLKGLGSVRLSAGRALVVCPADFVLDGPEGTFTNRGAFSEGQTVYEISSTCLLRDEADDQVFKIKLSEPNEDNFYVALHPQRNANCINFYQKLNGGIFLGFPRIRKLHKSGGWKLSSTNTLQYKTGHHKTWQTVTDTSSLLGRFRIRSVGAEGEVLYSREIAVLPPNFGVRFDAANQQIMLDQTAAFALSVYTDGAAVDPDIARDGSGHRITVQSGSHGDRLTIRLSASTANYITLHVPFPAASGTFLDGVGQVIPNNRAIDLQMLHGTCLVVNNVSATTQTHHITLTLNDIHNREAGVHTISKAIRIPPFSNVEVSLMKYRADLERLLSFSRGIDAVVRIQHNGGTSVCVSQYTHQARYDHQTGLITLKGTIPVDAGIRIQAFPLAERFCPEVLINLECGDEGWSFPDMSLAEGKWLFFSDTNSAVSLRPSVATRGDAIAIDTRETVDEIHEASHHSFDNRQTVLTDLFERMGDDFDNLNWITLDHLYAHTKHLPLNALDVWKALVCSNKGLVAFFSRSGSVQISKLSQEFSVSWRGIPVAVWLNGFEVYRTFLKNKASDKVADMVLMAKVQELESSFSFSSLGQIIRTKLLDETAIQEFSASKNRMFVQFGLNGSILGGGGMSGLIHQTKGKFPVHLSPDIINAFNQLPASVRDLLPIIPANFGYIRPVAYLPIVLAWHSVCPGALSGSAWDRQKVMQLIDFDTDYFNHILNLIQAYCWQTLVNQPII